MSLGLFLEVGNLRLQTLDLLVVAAALVADVTQGTALAGLDHQAQAINLTLRLCQLPVLPMASRGSALLLPVRVSCHMFLMQTDK